MATGTAQHFDVVVIGGGSGLTAAYWAVEDGKRVALVSDRPDALGGTCINFGCIPTKTLIESARVVDTVRRGADFGVHVDLASLSVDFPGIMQRMRRARGDSAASTRKWVESSMTPFYSRVRFVADKTLETEDGIRLSGDTLFIATGARAAIPSVDGLPEAGFWTNEDVLELERQPSSLLVIGGGYIGAELGYFFAALGTEVTVVHPRGRLLGEDADIGDFFTSAFSRRVQVVTGRATAAGRDGDRKWLRVAGAGADTRTLHAEQILVAAGRQPNSAALELGRTGIVTDESGAVRVDGRLRTAHPDIYAYGDVIGRHMFKHTSSYEGELAYRNSQGRNDQVDYAANPHAVFSEPEIAAVGLTEGECIEQGLDYRVARASYSDVAKGRISGASGLAKILVDRRTDRILGCHIAGPHAAILLHEVVAIMSSGGTADSVRRTIHVHPSLPELLSTLFEKLR